MASIEEFIKAPSEEKLNSFVKQQLWDLVEHFKISEVDKKTRKKELRSVVKNWLCKNSLMVVSPQETKGSDAKGSSDIFSGLSFEERKEILLMQQLHDRELIKETKQYELEIEKMRNEKVRRQNELDFEKVKIEAEKSTRDYELQVERLRLGKEGRMSDVGERGLGLSEGFDLASNLRLLPKFNDHDPDIFFSLFETMSEERNWPRSIRVVMLQTVITGKAQEAFAALTMEDRKDYDKVKVAILKAYELVPEAYRQRFRSWRKGDRQTHSEVVRDLVSYFDRWCVASAVDDFEKLRDLVILEQFKNIVPDDIATYINEKKPRDAMEAAVLADDYVLTHRKVYREDRSGHQSGNFNENRVGVKKFEQMYPSKSENSGRMKSDRDLVCNYCFSLGHWKNKCPVLAAKGKLGKKKSHISPVLVTDISEATHDLDPSTSIEVGEEVCDSKLLAMENFVPFITDGCVSLPNSEIKIPVKILRDTGSSESFITESVLPFSQVSGEGRSVLIRGIGLNTLSVPLYRVHLTSDLISGEVSLGVRPSLPVDGVAVILGNNLAGGRVWREVIPPPEVVSIPVTENSDVLNQNFPEVFKACVVTRARSREMALEKQEVSKYVVPGLSTLSPISHRELVDAQQEDLELQKLFDAVISPQEVRSAVSGCFIQDEVLVRKYVPCKETLMEECIIQVVVPKKFRDVVLQQAHGEVAGHLGVRKTYDRILRQFYWPRLKKDISSFIRTCHTCQLTGKPTQLLRPVPLSPIVVTSKPFEHLIIDCVGPLPPSKSGNAYLLTVMCQATRYPAAYALRSITTKAVVKALTQFISIFGIPKIIQSDNGTNFTSRMFAEVLRVLKVKHNQSSVYHPQSQGVIERFHQTLKSLLRAYCVELSRDWEEGLPWLLLAAREVQQESLGFSPNDLVFGHRVRGPLSVLREGLGEEDPPRNLVEYVNGFRRRLFLAGLSAQKNLAVAQEKMKNHFDKHAEGRVFTPGDQVLILLPTSGSPFCAKFTGPYTVLQKLSDENYQVATPGRRKSKQCFHVNLLKAYRFRNSEVQPTKSVAPVVTASVESYQPFVEREDMVKEDTVVPEDCVLLPRLKNSETLQNLDVLFSHLTEGQNKDLTQMLLEFSGLFSDIPTRTHLIQHDVDVGEAQPIHQRFYRVPVSKKEALESEVQYMLENGIAVPSCSSWASPCLLVRKADSTYRFCTDYRKLNAITKPDVFPLPRMEDCVDQVGTANFVSKLDLLKGYWQVPLTPRAREVTSFITSSGLYSYSVMSFGLRNAPATFQRLMNRVIYGLEGCAVYLDDVIVFSETWEQHLVRLRALLTRLTEACLTVNLAKCEFAKATVRYLGKEVGQGKVRPVQAKVLAIQQFPSPSTKKELMRFLGMVGYYRGFCPNFSTVVSPLTDLLKNSVKFDWSENCQRAFENVKLLLTTVPVLAAPRLDMPFKLQVDASQVGAGAVLLQTGENGLDYPVSFFSRSGLLLARWGRVREWKEL
nr:uncharacterized protein LOC129445823 [Misgurnus anguillicaudatus]XP_055062772.1 uncharacterized protein LOC129445823 [Misgurnus anguillicaudatus]